MIRSEAKESLQVPTPDLRTTPVPASGLNFLHQTIRALSLVTTDPQHQGAV